MNDDSTITELKDTLTLARDSLTGVRMGTSLDTIVQRGRAQRRRRGLAGLASVTAVAGVIAVAVATVTSSASPATVKLAAWTVAHRTDGTVEVTIQQVRDAGGLQQALRADGIPARVIFPGHDFEPSTSPPLPPSCQAVNLSDAQNAHLQERVMPLPPVPGDQPSDAVILIRPSAVPDGIGLSIYAWAAPAGTQGDILSVETGLVQASPGCTGS
jgi:hypothetical protein